MAKKIILFIFTVFIGWISSSAQETDSLQTEPEILIVHTRGALKPHVLNKKDQLKIDFRDDDKTVVGNYTYLNDSTIIVDGQEIKLNEIEQLNTTQRKTFAVGSFFSVTGAMLIASGVVMAETGLQWGSGQFLVGLAGAGIIILGSGVLLFGSIILGSSTHAYDMDRWHFYVE